MKKLKLFIRINIIILLLITLTLVSKAEQSKQELAKTKLEQAITEAAAEQKTVDISTMKDKIKDDVSNSKILNESSTQYPIYTIVDGYEFKVEENKKAEQVDNNDIMDEPKEDDEKEDNNIEENKSIVEYEDNTKTDKGITISTTKDGIITINGETKEKLFIKISKNIKISSNSKDFDSWAKEDRSYNRKRKKIKEKVTILNDVVAEGEINVALRNKDNEATGILKLLDKNTEYEYVLEKDITANYIFISENIKIENMKFKIEITEEETEDNKENRLELKNESKKDNDISIVTNEDGTIQINGKTKEQLFIKITNGINITSEGNKNTELLTKEPIIFNKRR